jgi:16S rRNA (guanine527-N7)-methyltransferase
MDSPEIVFRYFPNPDPEVRTKIEALGPLFDELNRKVNLISRKDIDFFYERHVLYSLAIARVISFSPGTRVLDVGTGGGFPAIPLAIMFPEVNFFPVDSIGKKIRAVQELKENLGLENVFPQNIRAEAMEGKFDFVVSRAVTEIPVLMGWIKKKIRGKVKNDLLPGLLYLKGGDLSADVRKYGKRMQVFPVKEMYQEEFFETKALIYLPVSGANS